MDLTLTIHGLVRIEEQIDHDLLQVLRIQEEFWDRVEFLKKGDLDEILHVVSVCRTSSVRSARVGCRSSRFVNSDTRLHMAVILATLPEITRSMPSRNTGLS